MDEQLIKNDHLHKHPSYLEVKESAQTKISKRTSCSSDEADDIEFQKLLTSTESAQNEAKFTRNEMQNFHNIHVWDDRNPKAVLETRHQQHFSINIWVGITGDTLIDPFILPGTLTAAS
ncbi:hypothetical protein ANN_08108 [Periplaneta americana]|uniref:Uncharacterized protein n=1 Tax=Periplaneta americana TaxID=6978 RepID=A0ABQ8T0G2_PERAM|nr:hypothetical protein ANN_08108 [Periplaneta americana]